MRRSKTAAYLQQMYREGLARSSADIDKLIGISTGRVTDRYPEYFCTKTSCDCVDRQCAQRPKPSLNCRQEQGSRNGED